MPVALVRTDNGDTVATFDKPFHLIDYCKTEIDLGELSPSSLGGMVYRILSGELKSFAKGKYTVKRIGVEKQKDAVKVLRDMKVLLDDFFERYEEES